MMLVALTVLVVVLMALSYSKGNNKVVLDLALVEVHYLHIEFEAQNLDPELNHLLVLFLHSPCISSKLGSLVGHFKGIFLDFVTSASER
jgi:hypothetical protein